MWWVTFARCHKKIPEIYSTASTGIYSQNFAFVCFIWHFMNVVCSVVVQPSACLFILYCFFFVDYIIKLSEVSYVRSSMSISWLRIKRSSHKLWSTIMVTRITCSDLTLFAKRKVCKSRNVCTEKYMWRQTTWHQNHNSIANHCSIKNWSKRWRYVFGLYTKWRRPDDTTYTNNCTVH